jgi:IS5 family transposase
MHAQEVECISKGKARSPDECGGKVSVDTTLKDDSVVGIRSLPGNPYDGHKLEEAIEQVSILAQQTPKILIVDRESQGAELEGTRILRSAQKRGISRTLHAKFKRRSAIEPTIGHVKTGGRLGRNPLKGSLGDALHAVLSSAGHEIRLLLEKLRLLFTFMVWAITGDRAMNHRAHELTVDGSRRCSGRTTKRSGCIRICCT